MLDEGTQNPELPRKNHLALRSAVAATAIGAALLVALVAFELQQLGVAPVIVFPLCVGLAAGGGLLLAERLFADKWRRGRWALAAACSLLAVVGQEGIGYVKVQQPQEVARLADPRLELFRQQGFVGEPTSFGSFFLARVREQPLWWTLDLLLAWVGGVGVVMLPNRAMKQSASGR